MERQSVVTHTLQNTEMRALLGSWVTKAPSVKMLCPQKKLFVLIFCYTVPVRTVNISSNICSPSS